MPLIICFDSHLSLLKTSKSNKGSTIQQELFYTTSHVIKSLLSTIRFGDIFFIYPINDGYEISGPILDSQKLEELFKRTCTLKSMSFVHNDIRNLLKYVDGISQKLFSVHVQVEIFLMSNYKNTLYSYNSEEFCINSQLNMNLITFSKESVFHTSTEDKFNNFIHLKISEFSNIDEICNYYLSSRRSLQSDYILKFGSYSADVCLIPPLSIFDRIKDVAIEILGFLNTSDADNPPVLSNHSISLREKTQDYSLPFMLCEVMQDKNIVALAKINNHNEDEFGNFAFIHPMNSSDHVLNVSLCQKSNSEFTWLGHLKYLAPLADFGGNSELLYPDSCPDDKSTKTKSPFPVRSVKVPSYNLTPFSNQNLNVNNPLADEYNIKTLPILPLQYMSWVVNENTFETEINKIIRLVKRLPEKPNIFFKELKKIQPLLLSFGYDQVVELILEAVESHKSVLISDANLKQESCSLLQKQICYIKTLLNR